MVLSLLVCFSCLGVTPVAPTTGALGLAAIPVISIVWRPGYTLEPQLPEVDFAVWADGKVQWRDVRRDWVKTKGEWGWTKGRHFEAKVDPKKVADAVRKIETSGAFSVKNWNLFPTDSSYFEMTVRSGNQRFTLRSQGEPENKVPYGWPRDFFERGRKAWVLVRSLTDAMKPKRGRSIRSPRVGDWD